MAAAVSAQEIRLNIDSLLNDLTIVEKEEAAAKEIRLKWITEERNRIRYELTKHTEELEQLSKLTPDPRKPRTLSEREDRHRTRDEIAFNDWASNNTPERRHAMVRGSGLNALLKILGPIAHCRKQRAGGTTTPSEAFPSLASSTAIPATEVSHYRINPATTAGSRVEFRLNRLPLEIEWPAVLAQNWKEECQTVIKLRDNYVSLLTASDRNKPETRYQSFEDFDNGCSLLQAKALHRKSRIAEEVPVSKRIGLFIELQDAVRYVEQLRASARRFRDAPNEFRVRTFPGGNVEDFIDFCYMHNMLFQPARPEDEEAYVALSRRMQDYARDIQYVEDWKSDVQARIDELQATDKELVWRASAQ